MTMHVNWRLEALTHRTGLSAGGSLHHSSLLLIGSFAHRVRSVRREVLVTSTLVAIAINLSQIGVSARMHHRKRPY